MSKDFYKKTLYLSLVICLFCVFHLTGAMAQIVTVTGKVTDQNNEAMPGVTVQALNTTTGTVTDVDGKYTISVPANAALRFSFIGYISQDIVVGDRRVIDVTLMEDVRQIEEVVVVGYGTMRKSDVTGAVLSVNEAQLKDRPVSNAMEAMQGKAAGVDITNNARPGELGDIRIRGERSITGGSNPLYVVDGIPIFGRNNINSINTNDIKSIEILKDASATAIYGSRGANGVILITTHSGEDGRFSVNYNGSLTFSKIVDSAERFDAGEWIDCVRWAKYYADRTNPRGDQPTQASDMAYFGEPYSQENVMLGWASGSWDPSKVKTTDWTKFVIQTGVTQNHTISVTGGTAKVTNYASLGYMDEKGTSMGQRFKRYSLNLNTKVKPVAWFELGGRLNGSWIDQAYGLDTQETGGSNATSGNILNSAVRIFPHAVPYDHDGNKISQPGGNNRVLTVVDEYKLTANERQMLNVMANVYAQVKLPLDGLSYRVEFGPSFRYRRNGIMALEGSSARDGSAGNYIRLNNQRDFVWTVNNMLLYNKVFGGVHSVNATLLQTASKTSEVGDEIQAMGDTYVPAKWNGFYSGMVGAGIIRGLSSSLSEEQLASYMARVNYGFNNRYLVTVSGRWDGSSVLAPGNKWSFFPSTSLAWRMDQEDFMKSVPVINQLKLRLGWGVTGNAAVGRYSTLGSIIEANYPYGSGYESFLFTYNRFYNPTGTGVNPPEMANKFLGWERTAQWNFGVDFGVLKNRINGSLELYKSHTTDLLLSSAIPLQTGFARTTANIGETENHGVELTLNTVNIKTASGFTWETNLNVAWQKNKIVSLSNGKDDEISASNPATETRLIGKPLGIYYNYKVDGIWRPEDADEMAKYTNSFEPGKQRVKDQNGDYTIDANYDRVYIGNTRPKWTGGMTNTFSYKGVELAVQMYGRFDYWTNGQAVSLSGFFLTRKVDYYTEANTNAKYQRPEYENAGGNLDAYSGANDYCKASFLNIRYISLGYRFPKNMINGWGGMQNMRVYAQIVNPGAIYSACDFKNMDVNSTFWNRSFVFGLNVGF